MLKDLYIVGAGGFGREVAWLVERINQVNDEWNIKGFIDDNPAIHGTQEGGYTVIGGCDYLRTLSESAWVICAIGNSKARKKIIEMLYNIPKLHFATLVDPSVIKSTCVTIQEGSIVCAGTVLTVDIKIGSHVIINLDCTIGHDAIIQDYVTIYPSANVSGNVSIGECVELGTGAQIIQGKDICSGSIIGAGAVVVSNIDKSGTYVGVPAKEAK